jgi:hypothetical protein
MSNIKASQSEKTAIVISAAETDAMRNAGGKSVTCNADAIDILSGFGVECLASRDSDLTAMLRVLFYEGAMRDGCNVDLDEAKRLLTLDSSKHKTSTTKRDPEHDRVYSLAKYNWSIACDSVGLPKASTGGNRGAKADKGGKVVTDVSEGTDTLIDAFHVPRQLDTEHAVDLFAKFADAMRRVLSSDKIKGEAGSVLRQCVSDVADYINDAKVKLEADKPVLSDKELMRAEILKELAAAGAVKAKFKLAA